MQARAARASGSRRLSARAPGRARTRQRRRPRTGRGAAGERRAGRDDVVDARSPTARERRGASVGRPRRRGQRCSPARGGRAGAARSSRSARCRASATGKPSLRRQPRASSSAWSKPRCRRRAAWTGTGTSMSPPTDGARQRAAISSASGSTRRSSPSYLSACSAGARRAGERRTPLELDDARRAGRSAARSAHAGRLVEAPCHARVGSARTTRAFAAAAGARGRQQEVEQALCIRVSVTLAAIIVGLAGRLIIRLMLDAATVRRRSIELRLPLVGRRRLALGSPLPG